MALPVVQAVGTPNHGTGAVTYTLPAHQAGDILLLLVECAESAGVTAPSQDGGWAHVTNSPRAQGANVTCVNVMWKRATSGAMTNPQVPTGPNHQMGVAMVIRGAIGTGNFWDFSPTGNGAAGTTSISATGGTTSVADTLVVVAIANNTDTTTDQFTSVANAALGSFTEQAQEFTTDGNGGGIGVYTGTKAVAGATGATTGTQPSGTYSALTLAVKPSAGQSASIGITSTTDTAMAVGKSKQRVVGIATDTSTAMAVGRVSAKAVGTVTQTNTAMQLRSGYWQVVNWIKNPSGETGLSHWLAFSDSSPNRSNTQSYCGSWGFSFLGAGLLDPQGLMYGFDGVAPTADAIAVTPGQMCYFGGMLRGDPFTPAGSHHLTVNWYTSGNVLISSSIGSTVVDNGDWQPMEVFDTAPATTAKAALFWIREDPVFDGENVADCFFFTKDTFVGYFDGDSGDSAGYTFAWTSTPHDSTSTVTANRGLVVVGLASESDTARPIGHPRAVPIASTTDTAMPIGKSSQRAVGIATEIDTAMAVGRSKARQIGFASTTATALQIDKSKADGVAGATETTTAMPITAVTAKAVGTAVETDTAQPIAHAKSRAIQIAVETDTARAVATGLARTVDMAIETDAAMPIGHTRAKAVGFSTESDTAMGVTAARAKAVTVAVETDAAQPLGRSSLRLIAVATTSDAALQLASATAKALATAAETDSALTLGRMKLGTAQTLSEAGQALPVTPSQGVSEFVGMIPI